MKKRLDQIFWQAVDAGRMAKKNAISQMAGLGRQYRFVRIPVMFVMFLYILMSDAILHLFITLRTKEQFSRGLAYAMAFVLVFNTFDYSLLAAEQAATGEIVAVEELDDAVANQTLPVDAKEKDITFPTSLNVTVQTVTEEELELETETIETETEETETETEEAETETEETELAETETVEETEAAAETEAVAETEVAEETAEAETTVEEPVEESSQPETAAPVEEPAATETPAQTEAPAENAAPAAVEEDTTARAIVDFLFPAMKVYAAEVEEVAEETEAAEENTEVAPATRQVVTTEEITLTGIKWRLDESLSTQPKFNSEVEGEVFVYSPILPEGYALATLLPTITVTIVPKDAFPFYEEAVIDGVKIVVWADAGVFPEGSKLSARRISGSEEAQVEAAVSQKRDENANKVESYSFDIKVLDAEGTEVQPDTAKGRVKVSFSMAKVANQNLDTDVYHTSNHNSANLEAEKLDTNENGETVEAYTDGFSYYTVEFGYDDMQYVLAGDASVALSEILATVGLSGTALSAVSSNPELFAISGEAGNLVVTAVQAFNTDETLTIRMDDGFEYVIRVTDSQGIEIGNHGYPYGENMESDITLLLDLPSGGATVYEWQVSDTKNGQYSPAAGMSGTVSADDKVIRTASVGNIVTSGKWYRCVVKANADSNVIGTSEPVQILHMALRWSEYWYISNGTMAISYLNANSFNVGGKFGNNWYCTSYSDKWGIQSSGEDVPATTGYYETQGNLSAFKFFFEEENDHIVYIDATMAQDMKHFGFATDIMVGDNDNAPTSVVLDRSGNPVQMQLIQTNSFADLENPNFDKDNTLSFVAKAITPANTYYVGFYSNVKIFAFNDHEHSSAGTYVLDPTNTHLIQMEGKDSGGSLSWMNQQPGSTIHFSFSVGSVNQTGASLTATVETSTNGFTILDAAPDTYYRLYKEDSEGNKNYIDVAQNSDGTYSPVSGDATGSSWIPGNLDGLTYNQLQSDTVYKVEMLTAEDYQKMINGQEVESSTTEIQTAVDPLHPQTDEEGNTTKVSVTRTDSTITVSNVTMGSGYTYALEDENGRVVTTYQAPTGEEGAEVGQITFTGLETDKTYYLVAKHDGNDNSGKVAMPVAVVNTEYYYTGSEQTLDPSQLTVKNGDATLRYGVDYTITGTTTATEEGDYQIQINFLGDLADNGTITKTWKVQKVPMTENACEMEVESVGYSGTTVTQSVVVKDPRTGRVLEEGVDYRILDDSSAMEQTSVGNYQIRIEGMGHYTGTVTKTWSINPVPSNSFSMALNVQTDEEGNLVGSPEDQVVVKDIYGRTLTKGQDYDIVVVGQNSDGSYDVRVTGKGGYYGTTTARVTTPKPANTITVPVSNNGNNGNPGTTKDVVRIASVQMEQEATGTPAAPDVKNLKVNNLQNVVEEDTDPDKDEVHMVVKAKPMDESSVEESVKTAVKAVLTQAYGGAVSENEIRQDYLDLSVLRIVKRAAANTTTSSLVPDTQSVLEIQVEYNSTNKYNLCIVRDHEGTTSCFAKLASRPTGNYQDGTYYVEETVDENGAATSQIYFYSRYFSTYTVAYTTVDVPVNLMGGTSVATASTSTQSGSDAAQAGQQVEEAAETEEVAENAAATEDTADNAAKTVPHTADENPIVWLWILLGTSGTFLGYRSKKELEDRLREDIR